ncbi:hypothetical protein ACVW1A_006160 [Bradyrhizobium sp. LB1.3]|jgi:hypothetical protein
MTSGFRWLQARFGSFATGLTRRAKHPVKPSLQKDFTFPNFGFMAYDGHPGPAKGAFAIVTTCGPGGGGRGSDGAGSVMTGRATVSPHATRYDTALESGLVGCQG